MNDAPASTAAKDQLKRLAGLLEPYEAELERVVAFWLERCLDHEHGGYRTQISRRGVVFVQIRSISARPSSVCSARRGLRRPSFQAGS